MKKMNNFILMLLFVLISNLICVNLLKPAFSQIIIRLYHGFSQLSENDYGVYSFDTGALHIAEGYTSACGLYDKGHYFSVDNQMTIGVKVWSESDEADLTFMIYSIDKNGIRTRITRDARCGEDDEKGTSESDVYNLKVGNYVLYTGNYNGTRVHYDIDFYECRIAQEQCQELKDD